MILDDPATSTQKLKSCLSSTDGVVPLLWLRFLFSFSSFSITSTFTQETIRFTVTNEAETHCVSDGIADRTTSPNIYGVPSFKFLMPNFDGKWNYVNYIGFTPPSNALITLAATYF